ncbi:hypothetical protein P9112_001804 [Eukaryota sp. TZLM1-RC]
MSRNDAHVQNSDTSCRYHHHLDCHDQCSMSATPCCNQSDSNHFYFNSTQQSYIVSSAPVQETSESSPLQEPFEGESSMLHDASSPPHSSSPPSVMYRERHCSFSDRSDPKYGVKCISSNYGHSLLLTYSGEVYGWGYNDSGQVFYNELRAIKSPIKLPLNNIVSISTGSLHSFALSSEGELYGWGCNDDKQIDMSSITSLPITLINIPYSVKEVYGGERCSFALTQEGQVVQWGNRKSFELLEGLDDVVYLAVDHDLFVAVDGNGDFIFWDRNHVTKIPVTQYITPKQPFKDSVLLIVAYKKILRSVRKRTCLGVTVQLFVIDNDGNLWKFSNSEPTKLEGLNEIVTVGGYLSSSGGIGINAAIDTNGKVFVWGRLGLISEGYEERLRNEPGCIEVFTSIEGISVGNDFLFAYNKNTVWARGRNDRGQLGTGDLIDRPQPVKICGSDIFGSFNCPNQPVGTLFSCLIKLIYFEYLNHLKNLFGQHPYTRARFLTKSSISSRVFKFANEVYLAHPIHNKLFLKDPQDLNLNEDICFFTIAIVYFSLCSRGT